MNSDKVKTAARLTFAFNAEPEPYTDEIPTWDPGDSLLLPRNTWHDERLTLKSTSTDEENKNDDRSSIKNYSKNIK